jgi:zinc protease
MLAYHKPIYPDLDDPAITVMGNILGVGPSSRLHSKLVEEQRIVSGISYEEVPGMGFPNLFTFSMLPFSGYSINQAIKNYDTIVNRFIKEGPNRWELIIAKKRLAMEYLEDMQSNESLADSLASAHLLFGNWGAYFDWYDEMIKVTPEDVLRVASLYLQPTNRTVAVMSMEPQRSASLRR